MNTIYIRILNAVVVAGITFFSTLSISYPPRIENIYASLIAFMLTFLVQIKGILNEYSEVKSKKKGGIQKCSSKILMLL